MKKILLFSAVVAAAMSANAAEVVYDFHKVAPAYAVALGDPEVLAWEGNYDFIDKYGATVNTDGEMMNVKNEETGEWQAATGRCISLEDGQTYNLAEIPADHAFICWDQEGKGPARTLWMKGWGSEDAWTDANYNAIDEANWVSSRNAIAFNRNGNTGSRTGTYVQFPAVENPTSLTIYIGHAGGKYIDKGLYALVTPVVDGVAGEPIEVQGPDDAVAKRYYKFDVNLPALSGNVAFRVGCGGSELGLYHVVIGTGGAGVEDLLAPVEDENAPVYNVMGVQVDANYKGLVIKNGKKYVQK